jgi:hypothetical protein
MYICVWVAYVAFFLTFPLFLTGLKIKKLPHSRQLSKSFKLINLNIQAEL